MADEFNVTIEELLNLLGPFFTREFLEGRMSLRDITEKITSRGIATTSFSPLSPIIGRERGEDPVERILRDKEHLRRQAKTLAVLSGFLGAPAPKVRDEIEVSAMDVLKTLPTPTTLFPVNARVAPGGNLRLFNAGGKLFKGVAPKEFSPVFSMLKALGRF